MPGDHCKLARDGDGGDVRSAPSGDPLVEGAQRTGRAGRVPGGLDEHVAGLAGTLFGDSPVPGRFGAGLVHPRVEAEVADQVPSCREARGVADRGQQAGCGHEVDTGQRHQPAHLGRGQHLLGERTLDRRDLAAKEVDPAQAGLDHLALIVGQALLRQPLAALDAEQISHGRPHLQVSDQDRVDLVLLARALPD